MDATHCRLPQDLQGHARALLARPADAHKYDFGRVVVIGGCQAMAGAPALAGMAALRAGAGVVEVCVPQGIAPVVAGFDPALIVHGLPTDHHGGFAAEAQDGLLASVHKADVVVCGPGMGQSPAVAVLVEGLWRDFPRQLLLDADGLNALAGLPRARLRGAAGQRLLTPHAGEMQRLLGARCADRNAIEAEANAYAAALGAVVLLKGPRSLVTDGAQPWHNATGNPGMATAGSGDVLSGVIAALCAQRLPAMAAARLGAWLHGLAGDLAAEAVGQPALTATDLLAHLPAAWLHIARRLPA